MVRRIRHHIHNGRLLGQQHGVNHVYHTVVGLDVSHSYHGSVDHDVAIYGYLQVEVEHVGQHVAVAHGARHYFFCKQVVGKHHTELTDVAGQLAKQPSGQRVERIVGRGKQGKGTFSGHVFHQVCGVDELFQQFVIWRVDHSIHNGHRLRQQHCIDHMDDTVVGRDVGHGHHSAIDRHSTGGRNGQIAAFQGGQWTVHQVAAGQVVTYDMVQQRVGQVTRRIHGELREYPAWQVTKGCVGGRKHGKGTGAAEVVVEFCDEDKFFQSFVIWAVGDPVEHGLSLQEGRCEKRGC